MYDFENLLTNLVLTPSFPKNKLNLAYLIFVVGQEGLVPLWVKAMWIICGKQRARDLNAYGWETVGLDEYWQDRPWPIFNRARGCHSLDVFPCIYTFNNIFINENILFQTGLTHNFRMWQNMCLKKQHSSVLVETERETILHLGGTRTMHLTRRKINNTTRYCLLVCN